MNGVQLHPTRTFFATSNSLQKKHLLSELHSIFTDRLIDFAGKCDEDDIHFRFGLTENLEENDVKKMKGMNYTYGIHLLLSRFVWKQADTVEEKDFINSIGDSIYDAFRNIEPLITFVKTNKDILQCSSINFLHVTIEANSNFPQYRLLARIMKNMIGHKLLEKSEEAGLNWNVMGQGVQEECRGALNITIHVTQTSAYVGLKILEYKDFSSNLWNITTSRYGCKLDALIERADVRDGMIVMDLNAQCGEMLLEVLKKPNLRTHCIGLVSSKSDGEIVKENLEIFLTANPEKTDFANIDFLAAEMKQFINFYAVDRIFATYPLKIDSEPQERDAYFRRLASILSGCRPFTISMLQCPNNFDIAVAAEEIMNAEECLRVRDEFTLEEYCRKTYVMILETIVPDD